MAQSVIRQAGANFHWKRPPRLIKRVLTSKEQAADPTYKHATWIRKQLSDGVSTYKKTAFMNIGARLPRTLIAPKKPSPQLSTPPRPYLIPVRQSPGMTYLTFKSSVAPVPSQVSALPLASLPYDSSLQEAAGISIFRTVSDLRDWRRQAAERGHSVALVPTMGALHLGHMSLIRKAATTDNEICVSIYVNPTQFGLNEDLSSYPETFEKDMRQLVVLNPELETDGSAGRVTAVFAPTTQEMYPGLPPTSEIDGEGSFVTITPLGKKLEGAARPVFFRGVATVVMKLLNIVQPEHVYFGLKDIQQVAVVQRMIKDFHLNTRIQVVGTKRTTTGLAFSSRNVYLGPRRIEVASVLNRALAAGQRAQQSTGPLSRGVILKEFMKVVTTAQQEQLQRDPTEQVHFELEYVSLADPVTMDELQEVDSRRGAILSGVVKMLPLKEPQPNEKLSGIGDRPVRIIDNILLGRAKTLETMGITTTKTIRVPETNTWPSFKDRPSCVA